MIKHTPGPWSAVPSVPEEGSECFWLRSGNGAQLGSINGPQNDEQTANANLVAAAPDLLAALEVVMGAHKFNVATMSAAEVHAVCYSAIAKAKS